MKKNKKIFNTRLSSVLSIFFICILIVSCSGSFKKLANTDSNKVDLDLSKHFSGQIQPVSDYFTEESVSEYKNFNDYTLPDPEYEIGVYCFNGNEVYAEAAKIDGLSQGISSRQLCIMRFNMDTGTWQTVYEYEGESGYGRIYHICEYKGRLFWNYIKMNEAVTSLIYEYDLENGKIWSIKEYSEIDQMHIFDKYLVLYEFISNDDKNIHVIDLDTNKSFKFSLDDLKMAKSFVIPSVYNGMITYALKNEDDGCFYIESANIYTNDLEECIKVGSSNILYAVRADDYIAWISEDSSKYRAYLYDNGELYLLYEEPEARLSLGSEDGFLLLKIINTDQESICYVDMANKTLRNKTIVYNK